MLKLPTWLRAALITGGQTLAAAVLVVLLDLLFDVQDWVRDPTNPVDLSGAATAVLIALVTFLAGLVTAIYRYVRPVERSYPDAIETTAIDVTGEPVPDGAVPAHIVFRGRTYALAPPEFPTTTNLEA